MELKELTDLIAIRQYVINAVSFPTTERKMVNELNGIVLLLDKKILGIIADSEFKDYIGYKNVEAAKQAAAKMNNIYSGIENKNSDLHKNIRNNK
jgi:hypothetical protein